MMSRTHPLDLHEIHSRIASSLDAKDLASCARVSRDWNDSFTPPLYTTVVLSKHGLSMESAERNKGFIQHLKIKGPVYEELSSASAEDDTLATIMTSTSLLKLHLVGNSIRSNGAQALAEALENSPSLAILELLNNSIGSDGAQALAEALKTNTTLAGLILRSNDIRDNGAQALADALKTNSTLAILDLRNNKIGDDGVVALAEALRTCSTLTSLNLQDNLIGEHGAQALATALKTNSTLTGLGLWGNKMGDRGAQALAEALKVNSTLTILDLGRSRIVDDGAKALAEALKINSTLTILDLRCNSIGDEGSQELAEALETSSTLATLDLGYSNRGHHPSFQDRVGSVFLNHCTFNDMPTASGFQLFDDQANVVESGKEYFLKLAYPDLDHDVLSFEYGNVLHGAVDREAPIVTCEFIDGITYLKHKNGFLCIPANGDNERMKKIWLTGDVPKKHERLRLVLSDEDNTFQISMWDRDAFAYLEFIKCSWGVVWVDEDFGQADGERLILSPV